VIASKCPHNVAQARGPKIRPNLTPSCRRLDDGDALLSRLQGDMQLKRNNTTCEKRWKNATTSVSNQNEL
jgi:hypothetical protein